MADTTTAPPPAPPAPPEPPASRRPRWRSAPAGPILALWALFTALLGVFGAIVPARLMGVAASKDMAEIKATVTTFSLAAAPVAALVWAVAVYSLVAWRHRGPQPPTEDGPPLRAHTPVQVVWLVVSSALCIFLLIWGLAAMQVSTARRSSGTPLVVDVTGQQWAWTYSYPDAGGVSSDTLYLPVNRTVVFHVSSKDVVHSFWIVQLGIKIDANPGEVTDISVTPDRTGTYTVRCAELCGLYHAYMQNEVRVVDGPAFATWLQANGGHAA